MRRALPNRSAVAVNSSMTPLLVMRDSSRGQGCISGRFIWHQICCNVEVKHIEVYDGDEISINAGFGY
jgi:hypothetical protein